MASLTIRKLDEGIKAYLRLRSAGNGRSVEEEVRVILARATCRAAGGRRHAPVAACRSPVARAAAPPAQPAASP